MRRFGVCLGLLLSAAFGAPGWSQEAGSPASELVRLADTSLPLAERAGLARGLGRAELGLREASERSSALAELARSASSAELRVAALEGLAGVEGSIATAALGELVRSLPPEEDRSAAKLLAKRSGAAEVLLELVRGSLLVAPEGRPGLRGAVLAELFAGFGRAFVEAGRPADRRLFSLGHLHTDREVRAAADAALETAIGQLANLRLDTRAVALFDELSGAGWSRAEMRVRTATFLIGQGRELDAARDAARSVEVLTRGAIDFPTRRLRFFGAYLEAAAELASGQAEATFAPLIRASLVLDGMNMQRLDLVPDPTRPSRISGAEAGDLLNLRGLVDLLAAYAAIAAGAHPGDKLVLTHLSRAHEFNLWSQLRVAATDDNAGPGSFDELFEHDFAPRRLVFSAPDNTTWSGAGRSRALDVALGVGRAAALVLGAELPGFEPPSDPAPGFSAPRDDPRRFYLLKTLRPAELAAVQRRLGESWDQFEMQMLELRRRMLVSEIEKDQEDGYADLSDLRLPSTFALSLAEELRSENRADEAVQLAGRLFEDLDAAGRLDEGAWGAWLAARVEISRGGAMGDAGRPRDAIGVLESAVRRLEAVENTIQERRAAERDPRNLAIFDQQLEQTQRLRAQALVGLAVNSNVRLGDPERALVYFEVAYQLDDSDFMRGLLACYRARFGAKDEARALLRTIRPAPAVYYNLACAWALLGDHDQAMAMLQREFAENHPTPGSLARQKRWSREDPDLASLAEDPRFVALTAP